MRGLAFFICLSMPELTNPSQIDALDKLQREDHDRLVRVEEVVKAIAIDLKELNEGTSKRLVDVENEVEMLQRRFDTWETSVKTLRWVVGILAAGVMFVIGNISGLWEVFR